MMQASSYYDTPIEVIGGLCTTSYQNVANFELTNRTSRIMTHTGTKINYGVMEKDATDVGKNEKLLFAARKVGYKMEGVGGLTAWQLGPIEIVLIWNVPYFTANNMRIMIIRKAGDVPDKKNFSSDIVEPKFRKQIKDIQATGQAEVEIWTTEVKPNDTVISISDGIYEVVANMNASKRCCIQVTVRNNMG